MFPRKSFLDFHSLKLILSHFENFRKTVKAGLDPRLVLRLRKSINKKVNMHVEMG